MPTATTTIGAIIKQMETTIRGLTPALLDDVAFRIMSTRRDFEEWSETNPAASFRRYQIRDVGEYEPPTISNTDVEMLTTELELTMSYPMDLSGAYADSTVPPDDRQDVEDLMRQDMHQIRDAIGINGSANYATGQIVAREQSLTIEDGESVIFLTMPFETIFYRSMP